MSMMPSNAGKQLEPPGVFPSEKMVEDYMKASGQVDRGEAIRELNAMQAEKQQQVPTAADPVNPQMQSGINMAAVEQPTIGAATPAQELQMEREAFREEFVRASNKTVLDETPMGRMINTMVADYAQGYREGIPWMQGVADVPYMNIPAGVGQGIRNFGINTDNTILSLLGYDLDYLPNPADTAVDYGDNAMVGSLAEGFSQFTAGMAMFAAGGHMAGITRSGIALSAFSGAMTDATYDPRTGNISTMIREFFPNSAYDAYLEAFDSRHAYNETGNELYARFLSSLEGAAVGEVAAPLLLGTALKSLKGMAGLTRGGIRGAGDIAEGVSSGLRLRQVEASGVLDNPFLDGDLHHDVIKSALDRPASPALEKLLNQATATFMARQARFTALAQENPELSLRELTSLVNEELPISGDGGVLRDAAAQVMVDVVKNSDIPLSKDFTLEEAKALMTFADPTRTFFVTDNIPASADMVLYQDAVNGARGTDLRDSFERLNRSDRRTGEGQLSGAMNRMISDLRKKHDLTAKDVAFIKERLSKTLKDFPLEEWQKIEADYIFPRERNEKGEAIEGTSVLRRDKDDNPVLDLKFKEQTYSFANVNPLNPNSPVIDRAKNPKLWNRRIEELSDRLVDEVRGVVERVTNGRASDIPDRGAESILHARTWYQSMRDSLDRVFGGLSRLFSEMLGATSPQTAVAQNFRYTREVITNYSRGAYDDLIERYANFRASGGTFETWTKLKNDIIFQDGVVAPADSTGAAFRKYGSNGGLVMDTLAGHWLGARYSRAVLRPDMIVDYAKRGLLTPEDFGISGMKATVSKNSDELTPEFMQILSELEGAWKARDAGAELTERQIELLDVVTGLEARASHYPVAGGAPKAFNFASNLMGRTRAATIDLWAARNLDRLAGVKALPPNSEKAVVGKFLTNPQFREFGGDIRSDSGATGSAFGMGQLVFDRAAQKMRDLVPGFENIRPDDLQALVWFLEKEYWSQRGWTSLSGAGGSFDFELAKYIANPEDASGLGVFELDMARDMLQDRGGRVLIGASTVTDNPAFLRGEQRYWDNWWELQVPQPGTQLQISSPIADSIAMGIADDILRNDNTVIAYSMARNEGLFELQAETSIAIEMTYGRVFGAEDRFRPTSEADVARLTSGELERVDVGNRRDVIRDAATGEVQPRSRTDVVLDEAGNPKIDKKTGKPVKEKTDLQKSQKEYPLLEEPDMSSALHIAARLQQDFNQKAVLVSRVLDPTVADEFGLRRSMTVDEILQKTPNARPGFELMFEGPRSPADVDDILRYLRENYLGAQFIVDTTGTGGARRRLATGEAGNAGFTQSGQKATDLYVGIRVLDVPEFGADADLVREAGGAAYMRGRFEEFDNFVNDLAQINSVAEIKPIVVDTVVIGDEAGYTSAKEILDASGAVRENAGEIWGGRPWYESRPADVGEGAGGAGGAIRGADVAAADGGDPGLRGIAELNDGDATLYQSAYGPGGRELTARGAAVVDREEGIALIKFFRSADRTTAVHEMGHAIRVTQMGARAKAGEGALSAKQIQTVENAYGVKDGNWTRAQEERFAEDFEKYIAAGGPRGTGVSLLPKELAESFDFTAAAMRDIYKDAKSGTVSISKDVAAVLDRLVDMRGLPVRYAPYRYVRVGDFREVIRRIDEADKAGMDIMEVITPEDILGTNRRTATGEARMAKRFDVSTPEDALKLIAHFNAFTRELLESDALMRPQSRDKMVRKALDSLNGLMGRDPDMIDQTMAELLGGIDMRVATGRNTPDSKIMAANMLLVFKAQKLVELAKQAGKTGSPLDIAMMHRASLEYQVVQAGVSSAGTNWGRMGHAMQNVALPSADELANPKVADEFLRGLGMRPGTLVQESDDIINGLALVEIPRDAYAIGQILRNEAMNRGAIQKTVDIMKEYFVNNLLSGPKTWFTLSVFSPMLNMALDSTMRITGGLAMRALGDSRGMNEVAREFRNIRQSISQAMISFEYALRAAKNEQGVIMPGTNLYDGQNRFAISSDASNPIARHIINGTGQFVRSPSRAIMTFDEFFRQVNARVHLFDKFNEEVVSEMIDAAKNNGMLKREPTPVELEAFLRSHSSRIQDEVTRRTDEVIRDGRIRDQNAIIDEARAKPEIAGIENDMERALAIRDYYNDQWTQTHKRNVAYAKDYATRAVFQSELEGFGAAIQRGIDNNLGGTLRFLIPFFRTPWNIQAKFFSLAPTNILAELMSRSLRLAEGKGFTLPEPRSRIPYRTPGAKSDLPSTSNLGAFHRRHLEDLASEDPKRVAEARGRQAAGVAITTAVFSLADAGKITGGGPDDPQERAIWMDAGWRPYSFKIGDTYVSYNGWDPLAQYLALAADTHMLLHKEDGFYSTEEEVGLMTALVTTMSEVGQSLFITTGRQMQEKPYVQGISQVLNLFDRDDMRSFERLAGNLALGFVPFSAAQQQISMGTDDVVREHRDIIEFLNARSLFGANENVAPRMNFLGEPVRPMTESTGAAWNWINRVNVSKVSQLTDDPVMLEFFRLGAAPRRIEPVYMEQDLRKIPASDGQYSAFDEWQRNVAAVRAPGTKMTLRETLEDLFAQEDWQVTRVMSPDPVSGVTPAQEQMLKIVTMYRELAWELTMSRNPQLAARMNSVEIDRTKNDASNAEMLYGEDSSISRTLRRGVDRTAEMLNQNNRPVGAILEDILKQAGGTNDN